MWYDDEDKAVGFLLLAISIAMTVLMVLLICLGGSQAVTSHSHAVPATTAEVSTKPPEPETVEVDDITPIKPGDRVVYKLGEITRGADMGYPRIYVESIDNDFAVIVTDDKDLTRRVVPMRCLSKPPIKVPKKLEG
jgi:hypothetical protein